MVREFTLVDGSGEEYSLTNEEHLLYNPSGLGFEYENTYRQVGHRFILANSIPKQAEIQGTIHFSAPDAYFDYQEFVEFCGRNGLKLEYRLAEMASRRIKKETGTVIWSQIENGLLSGMYDFITGDYSFTECLIEVGNDTVVTEETSLLQSYTHYSDFPVGLRLYSITVDRARDTTVSPPSYVYCNGLPAMNWNIDDTNQTFSYDGKYASGTVSLGGNSNKLYFVVMLDALDGKTIKQWLIDNNAKFAYTLASQITGTNTTFQFDPRLMYNPTVEFIDLDANNYQHPGDGTVSYETGSGSTIEESGGTIELEDTVVGQQLDDLYVRRQILNKSSTARFLKVDTDYYSSEDKTNWATIAGSSSNEYYNNARDPSYIYFKDNRPLPYIYGGNYLLSGTLHVSVKLQNLSCVQTGYAHFGGVIDFYIGRYESSDPDSSYRRSGSVFHHVEWNGENPGYYSNGTSGAGFVFTDIQIPFNSIVEVVNNPFDEEQPFNAPCVFSLKPFYEISYPEGLSRAQFNWSQCRWSVNDIYIENFCLSNAETNIYPSSVSDMKINGATSTECSIYQADSQHYQRGIFVSKLEKTELTKFSSLECKVTMECLEPWGDPFAAFVKHSATEVNKITLDSDSNVLSPCDLYINGPCTSPSWSHTVDGVEVTTGKYNGNIASGETLVVQSMEGNCAIYLIGGSGNTDDVYKNSDFATDRFIYIRQGTNVITVTDETDPTTQIDCKIEGELYYESV